MSWKTMKKCKCGGASFFIYEDEGNGDMDINCSKCGQNLLRVRTVNGQSIVSKEVK